MTAPAPAVAMPDTRIETAVTPDVPRSGDVVVSTEDHPGRFAMRQVPGLPSMLWESRSAAMGVARSFARAHGVAVWFHDGHTHQRVHMYRTAIRRPA